MRLYVSLHCTLDVHASTLATDVGGAYPSDIVLPLTSHLSSVKLILCQVQAMSGDKIAQVLLVKRAKGH